MKRRRRQAIKSIPTPRIPSPAAREPSPAAPDPSPAAREPSPAAPDPSPAAREQSVADRLWRGECVETVRKLVAAELDALPEQVYRLVARASPDEWRRAVELAVSNTMLLIERRLNDAL